MAAIKVEMGEVENELETGVSQEKSDKQAAAEAIRRMARRRQADKDT